MGTAKRSSLRFGKPSMAGLPYELGSSIIRQIMNTPKPDFTKADAEIAEIMKRLDEEDAERNE